MTRSKTLPFATLLLPAEAAAAILRHIEPLASVRAPLSTALGRVLAEDIASPIDLPAWDNSGMDGFAVRGEDVRGKTPIDLTIIEDIPAGSFPRHALRPGTCSRIFTGAPVPKGADTVIRQEDTTTLGNERVTIGADRDVNRNVRPRGEDMRKGQLVLQRGTPLGPAQMGVLASIAQREVSVYKRPTVAVLATGDEIAELEEHEAILAGRKVASSNSYTLRSMIELVGAEPLYLGIAKDDPGVLRERIEAAAGADLFITSAGVSVGEHDYLRPVLTDLGATLEFWRIRMRPGAPVGFGILNGLPWLGLPGNPVSTMVTFELFVRPALRKMLGHTALFRRAVPVTVSEPIRTNAPLRHFLRVVIADGEAGPTARLTGPQGSGILTSMVRANALLIVPEDRQDIPAGEVLNAIRLEEPEHVPDPPY